MSIPAYSAVVLAAASTPAATQNGSAVNVRKFRGLAKLVVASAAAAASTSNVLKVQSSEDGLTNWTDTGLTVTINPAFTSGVYEENFNIDQVKAYLRVVETITGTPAAARSVMLVAKG